MCLFFIKKIVCPSTELSLGEIYEINISREIFSHIMQRNKVIKSIYTTLNQVLLYGRRFITLKARFDVTSILKPHMLIALQELTQPSNSCMHSSNKGMESIKNMFNRKNNR